MLAHDRRLHRFVSPLSSALPSRHLLLNLRLWSAAAPATQRQLQGLWAQLAAGEPLLVRRLLPPARILHHVRACFFSGGAGMREQARRQAAAAGQLQQLRAATPPAAALANDLSDQERLREQHAQPAVAFATTTSPAEAAELRQGYIRLAATLIGESAAAAARQGGLPAGSGEAASTAPGSAEPSFSARDEGLGADLRAALSLLADCCTSLAAGARAASAGTTDAGSSPPGLGSTAGDAALLQELLTLLLLPLLRRDSLARLPLLACLHRGGGPALLLPLLRLEQQPLRLLGLRAITASLSAAEDDQDAACGGRSSISGSMLGRARSATPDAGGLRSSLGSPDPEGQNGESEQGGVIAAAGQLLAGHPLTAATRIALLEMLCDGAPWTQVHSCALLHGLACMFPCRWNARPYLLQQGMLRAESACNCTQRVCSRLHLAGAHASLGTYCHPAD